MSQYAAVVLAGLGIMFFLTDVAFRILEVDRAKKHQHLSLFLILGSIVIGWAVLNVGIQVAEDAGMGADVINGLSYAYWAFIVIGGLVMIYFVLYFLITVMKRVVTDQRNDEEGFGIE